MRRKLFMAASDAASCAQARAPSIHFDMNMVHDAGNALAPALRRAGRLRHRAPSSQHDPGGRRTGHDPERGQPPAAPARGLCRRAAAPSLQHRPQRDAGRHGIGRWSHRICSMACPISARDAAPSLCRRACGSAWAPRSPTTGWCGGCRRLLRRMPAWKSNSPSWKARSNRAHPRSTSRSSGSPRRRRAPPRLSACCSRSRSFPSVFPNCCRAAGRCAIPGRWRRCRCCTRARPVVARVRNGHGPSGSSGWASRASRRRRRCVSATSTPRSARRCRARASSWRARCWCTMR